jgi:uncharacterized membrane protein (Fun14 family)
VNPLRWPRAQRVALVVASLVGSAIGLLAGYSIYAIGRGAEGTLGFSFWVWRSHNSNALLWLAFGALVGFAKAYALRLLIVAPPSK